jgi:hypothetical protein
MQHVGLVLLDDSETAFDNRQADFFGDGCWTLLTFRDLDIDDAILDEVGGLGMTFWRCQLHCIRAVAVAVHDIVDIAVLQGEHSTRTAFASVNHGHHCVPLATNAIRSHVQQTDQRGQRLGCVSIQQVTGAALGSSSQDAVLDETSDIMLTICDGLSRELSRL